MQPGKRPDFCRETAPETVAGAESVVQPDGGAQNPVTRCGPAMEALRRYCEAHGLSLEETTGSLLADDDAGVDDTTPLPEEITRAKDPSDLYRRTMEWKPAGEGTEVAGTMDCPPGTVRFGGVPSGLKVNQPPAGVSFSNDEGEARKQKAMGDGLRVRGDLTVGGSLIPGEGNVIEQLPGGLVLGRAVLPVDGKDLPKEK